MNVPKQEYDSVVERLTEIRAEQHAIPEAPSQAQGCRVAELHRETTTLLSKLAEPADCRNTGTATTEPENNRSNLACPKCNSTELDFMGLYDKTRTTETLGTTEPDIKMVSGNYKWKCRNCKHQFEITIHN